MRKLFYMLLSAFILIILVDQYAPEYSPVPFNKQTVYYRLKMEGFTEIRVSDKKLTCDFGPDGHVFAARYQGHTVVGKLCKTPDGYRWDGIQFAKWLD